MHFQPVPRIEHGSLNPDFPHSFVVYILAKDYLCEQFTEIFGPKDRQWTLAIIHTKAPDFRYAAFSFKTEAQLVEAYVRFNGIPCQ